MSFFLWEFVVEIDLIFCFPREQYPYCDDSTCLLFDYHAHEKCEAVIIDAVSCAFIPSETALFNLALAWAVGIPTWTFCRLDANLMPADM